MIFYIELRLVKGVKFSNEKRAEPALKCIADFAYTNAKGEYIVEDVKSTATKDNPVFRIKKHLMLALMNIEVVEV